MARHQLIENAPHPALAAEGAGKTWCLPFVPQHYDDELLGNWLARTKALTHSGAWRVLLDAAGFGRKMDGPTIDLIDHSERLEALFRGLKTTYAVAVPQLTTISYWSALCGHKQM